MSDIKKKFVVKLIVERAYYTHGLFGNKTGMKWVKWQHAEPQIVFNSYKTLKETLNKMSVENRIARSADVPNGHFRYKIFDVFECDVVRTFDQNDIDSLLDR